MYVYADFVRTLNLVELHLRCNSLLHSFLKRCGGKLGNVYTLFALSLGNDKGAWDVVGDGFDDAAFLGFFKEISGYLVGAGAVDVEYGYNVSFADVKVIARMKEYLYSDTLPFQRKSWMRFLHR